MSEEVTDGMERIPFDSKFLEPVVRGEKDATLRLERYDVEAGDHIILTNKAGRVEWARAEVAYTFTCRASTAYQVLDHLNARHALTKTDKNVCEVLQPHYDEAVQPSDTVQGIRWEVVQRFAEPPEATIPDVRRAAFRPGQSAASPTGRRGVIAAPSPCSQTLEWQCCARVLVFGVIVSERLRVRLSLSY
jgi:hypothetical protein